MGRAEGGKIIFTVPPGMLQAVHDFTRREGYRSPREALCALIEGALVDYPRWGVKRGIGMRVSAEIRTFLLKECHDALKGVEQNLINAMAQPTEEDMMPFEPPLEDLQP